jgi:acyl-CoA oxidase
VEAALVDLLSFQIFPTGEHLLGQDPTRELRKAIQHLELKLLPQAVGLTDAFGFSDWELDRYAPFTDTCDASY